MLDFLRDCEISENTINNMYKAYDENVLYNLSCNYIECAKIIEYLKQKGVSVIEDLLEVYIDVFLSTFDMFNKKISKYDINNFVENLNSNIETVELLMN